MADALRDRMEALAQNEARFHAIADYSYDVELWIGTEGRLIWINPRVHEMFGYTPEECLAMDNFPAALVDPEDVVRTIRQIRQALRGNAGQDFEFRARRKDGTLLWGAADWRPIYGSDREYLGIRISIRDVSQRREAEQRLAATVVELREAQAVQQDYLKRAQDEHARLSALLSAMEFGILFVNTENRVVYTNPAFNRLWQIGEAAQLLGQDPLVVLETIGVRTGAPRGADAASLHAARRRGARRIRNSACRRSPHYPAMLSGRRRPMAARSAISGYSRTSRASGRLPSSWFTSPSATR